MPYDVIKLSVDAYTRDRTRRTAAKARTLMRRNARTAKARAFLDLAFA